MKKLMLFITAVTVSKLLFSQVLDPMPGLKPKKTLITTVKRTPVLDTKGIVKMNDDGSDYLYKNDTTVEELTTPARVAIYGLTSLTNSAADALDNLNATGRFGISFFPHQSKRNFKINMAANLLNAKPEKGISKDSLDFGSLMFPETGNFGLMFNPAIRLRESGDKEHSFWIEGSFCYRKVSIDSPSISFKALSYTLGMKWLWEYAVNEEDKINFGLTAYWNLFNIPNEDVARFKSLLNDPLFDQVNKGMEIHSIGAKLSMQYKNFIFFFDIRNNMKTAELNDDNPFKGTKANIGFATALAFKSF